MRQGLRWLHLGLEIKRWLLTISLGLIIAAGGIALVAFVIATFWAQEALVSFLRDLTRILGPGLGLGLAALIMVVGVAIVRHGVSRSISAIFGTVQEDLGSKATANRLKRLRAQGPRVVAIGGGTGLGSLLRGLKEMTSNITAIVTVADDGGSSGRIRQEWGMLPPGDIRNCLLALADTEPLLERLFQYRFSGGEGLVGHSFGNLFIVAMTDITGDFERGIREFSRVLAVRGHVIPSTYQEVVLGARLASGRVVWGESEIPLSGERICQVFLEPQAKAPAEALEAIRGADLIVLGPGSLYTSVLPNLLVEGVVEAIRSTDVPVVYICNVMTQPGETDGYTVGDHLQALLDHTVPGLVDFVLINSQRIPEDLQAVYQCKGARPVEVDMTRVRGMNVEPILEPVLGQLDLVRHDPDRLATAVLRILNHQAQAHTRVR